MARTLEGGKMWCGHFSNSHTDSLTLDVSASSILMVKSLILCHLDGAPHIVGSSALFSKPSKFLREPYQLSRTTLLIELALHVPRRRHDSISKRRNKNLNQLAFGGDVGVANRFSAAIAMGKAEFLIYRFLQEGFPARHTTLRLTESMFSDHFLESDAHHLGNNLASSYTFQVLHSVSTHLTRLKLKSRPVIIHHYGFFSDGQGEPDHRDGAVQRAGEAANFELTDNSFFSDGTRWTHPVLLEVIKLAYFDGTRGHAIASHPGARILLCRITDEALAFAATLITHCLEELVNRASNLPPINFNNNTYAPIYAALLQNIKDTHNDLIHGFRLEAAQAAWARALLPELSRGNDTATFVIG
ncbi:hypothetical protein BDN72DRAFT_862515 [Pluteus cervinus]|uniref:Uncharacterized protein n=1 Tax=Pluteus cervinus TaxID=181527 RepID=A0ACD3ABU8_9AGAR|nr:hypothetical protein BDN72DRAFT_862515 [Pluteus cervinus]